VKLGDYSWLLAPGADVLVACAQGHLAAGVVGKDLLAECDADVYELLDLRVLADRLVYAEPAASGCGARSRPRVATHYPRLARAHFSASGRQVEPLVFAAASLAPLLGLADGVVELESRLAATELGLEVREEVARCSARLVAGGAARVLEAEWLAALSARLRETLEDA
jgi:ATP phosphoribosyltransferase